MAYGHNCSRMPLHPTESLDKLSRLEKRDSSGIPRSERVVQRGAWSHHYLDQPYPFPETAAPAQHLSPSRWQVFCKHAFLRTSTRSIPSTMI